MDEIDTLQTSDLGQTENLAELISMILDFVSQLADYSGYQSDCLFSQLLKEGHVHYSVSFSRLGLH